jgi:acyl-CoA thioester hydrolase
VRRLPPARKRPILVAPGSIRPFNKNRALRRTRPEEAGDRIVTVAVPPPYEFVVPEAWCDYNQHFSDGYFLVAFSTAADVVLDAVGLGPRYRARGHHSAYTVEATVQYRQEAKAGDALTIVQGVRGHDEKRLWVYQDMMRGDTLVASCVTLYLHVDTSGPKVVPFPPDIQERTARLKSAQPPRPEAA